MKTVTTHTDRLAIGLSSLCVIHCLAAPFLVVLLPGLNVIHFNDEAFHLWLLIAVIPISFLSLSLGCSQHRNRKVMTLGFVGLAILFSALFVENFVAEGFANGENLEKILTVLGACIVAASHYLNFSLCQQLRVCDCQTPS